MLVFEDVDSILDADDSAFERVFFTPGQGEFAGRRFEVEFEVCLDPTCPCTLLHWIARPEESPTEEEVFHFALDIDKRSWEAGDEYDAASLSLAKSIMKELSSEDWVELEDIFYTGKADLSNDFDPSDVDAVFDDQDDAVYTYGEIFPFAEPFLFTADKGVEMVAFDSYDAEDATPNAFLTIYRADLAEEEMDEKSAINLVVDYTKRQLSRQAEHSPKVEPLKLLSALEIATDDFWSLLAKRHNNLCLVRKKQTDS